MANFATKLQTLFWGQRVGEDEFGNRYYKDRRTKRFKSAPSLRKERRWVMYNGKNEASKVPPLWHAWLHHTVNVLPKNEEIRPQSWQKQHLPNLTGTKHAYHPHQTRPVESANTQDQQGYQSWKPE